MSLQALVEEMGLPGERTKEGGKKVKINIKYTGTCTVFMLIEYKLENFNFNFCNDFLIKMVTCYIKIHYEKSQNDFLALIKSCILLA